ncbi:angiotensin-converting enzyme [Plutella xylostella]|uniref:angiotensin-converting enzyme n=1 Tax=Plutella xylostella TaxID=51655 RepID=UPI002032879F|nr:angiotensin-converting enzyme [Plutella xylostella]XP_048477685.1 angiotensin-converting enzyme [Plutella xylostella]
MRPSLLPALFLLLSCSGTSMFRSDDRLMLESLVELIEMDYEDHCEQRAAASWDELVGAPAALQRKLERDKVYGIFSKKQTHEIRSVLTTHMLSPNDDILRRKVKLLLEPGDTMLDTEQWIRLVTFGDTALHNLRYATDYDCGSNANCTLRELHKSLTLQHDDETLRRMKASWEQKLPSLDEYRQHILPLLRNASKEYNYTTVEEYWDSLAEYEGGLLKARELWDQVKPLYLKLQKYVSLRLRGEDAIGKPIPVHLLKSLTGDDWSNVIELLLPKHADIYQKLHANLQLKNLGGEKAYKRAAKLIEELNFGPLEPQLWTESNFNGQCPPILVDSCKPNNVKIYTCKDVSIANYMDAHEAVMKIKYKEVTALHSNNTYVLRDANRYSALYEAIPGFASLLSLTPHALNRAGLYPLERFNYRNNPNHHRLVLQLIIALRDLPKLNYYLAADEWRLQVLMGSITSSKVVSSWSEFRKNFSLVDSADVELLSDPHVTFNKPFLGKFMGLILKYQIYQTFAEELISDDADLAQHVSVDNSRLMEAMSRGYGVLWPAMLSDLLAKREYGLEFTALTDYFRLLDEYLDNQLDPSLDTNEMEYEEPPVETPVENEIPIEKDADNEVELDTHANILENVIDTGDDGPMKQGVETSTVGVLEIKNPVGANNEHDEIPAEASYSTYWWIGIAVALAVVVLLIAIIAKKRHSHRKQLERQRRDTSHA